MGISETGDKRVKFNSKHLGVAYKSFVEMCEVIGKIYANDIEEVVMYSSYARGQETDESDIDMAIVLKAKSD